MKNELYSPKEGYIKGNIFKNEYIPYKDYRPRNIIPSNDQENLLLNINELSFYTHELNLFLDINPENQELINEFNHYRKQLNELTFVYEEQYGPLNIESNSLDNFPFLWSTLDFPMDGGNSNV